MMSSNVHPNTLQILTSVSVFTFSPRFSLLTVYVLILAAAAKSFFFISLSIRSFHNLFIAYTHIVLLPTPNKWTRTTLYYTHPKTERQYVN